MIPTRNIWFPLRSNLGYFETSAGRMALEERAKQMVILSDELFFEAGMVTVDVAETFVLGPLWRPPGSYDAEEVVSLQAVPKGESFAVALGLEPSPGVPAPPEAMRRIGGGPRQRGFVAEYEQMLVRSKLAEQPWAHLVLPQPDAAREADAIRRSWDSFDFGYSRDAPRLSRNSLLDGALKKGLNHDLATAEALGVPAAVDRLHKRMLKFKAEKMAAAGIDEAGPVDPLAYEALTLWVPDFSDRPWREIVALHDHDAIGEYRAKLVEAELEVASLRGRARSTALAQIGIRETTEALRRRFPSLKRAAFGVVLEAVSGLALGRLSVLASVTKQAAELRRAQQEWTAVHLALTKRRL